MDKIKSKVYILTDDRGRILRCEGGYTMSNIDNTSEWIFIDEGEGDKFNLCQSHYFPDGLFTDDGIARYKFADGAAVLRTYEEMEADRAALPIAEPTASDGDILFILLGGHK